MSIINVGDSPLDADVQDGTELATRLNRLYAAVLSTHASSTRPATITAGGVWVKYTAPSTYEPMMYDGTNDIPLKPKTAQSVNIKDFGGVGDGTANDTAALTAARNYAIANNIKVLYLPTGTWMFDPVVLQANTVWVGDGSANTKVKLRNGSNNHLIRGASTSTNDLTLIGMTFDGNRTNNTVGDIFNLTGIRHNFIDLGIINATDNGIVTNWDSADGGDLLGPTSYFANISIDTCGKSGWVHNGPTDSYFSSIKMVDCGLSTTNTYYGLYVNSTGGSGRFDNVHHWSRSTTTSYPIKGVNVLASGCTFTNCHFESGGSALTIQGNNNEFYACSAYAPRGDYCIEITGICNSYYGSIGIGAYSGNPNYKGVRLANAANNLQLTSGGGGLTEGIVDFTSDGGNNNIIVTGWQGAGVLMVGTPQSTDDVSFKVIGPAGGTYYQNGRKVSGWGTPTNGTRIANFNASTATTSQTAQALAQLIADLKTHGLLGT